MKTYRQKNRAKRRAYNRRYRIENRDKVLAYERKRRPAKGIKPGPPKKVKQPKQPQPYQPPAPVIPLDTELQRHIDLFLNAKAMRAPKTIQSYKSALGLLAAHLGEKWPIDGDDINSFMAACKGRGCNDLTCHTYWRQLRAFFRWLHLRGKIETNPLDLAEKPSRPRPLPRVPKEHQIKALFDYLKSRVDSFTDDDWKAVRDLALFSLLLDSGLRVGEASKLELDDIDLERRTVTLRETKTQADGVSHFSEDVARLLADWLEARAMLEFNRHIDYVFVSTHYRRKSGKLWGRFTEYGIEQAMRRLCEQAGIKRITPHQLRHACAVFSLRYGSDLLDVQRQLRHKSPAMTYRYLLVDDSGRGERHAAYSPVANLI